MGLLRGHPTRFFLLLRHRERRGAVRGRRAEMSHYHTQRESPLTPLALTPQPTPATPRELTLGMIYRLFLERSQRRQSDVAEQLNTQVHNGTDHRQRGSDWTWKLNRVATDKRRFSAQEY